MRRKTKKSTVVKVITTAAAVAALSAGTALTAYGASPTHFRVGVNGPAYEISQLTDVQRQSIIDAFNSADPLFVGDNNDWEEMSQTARVGDFTTAPGDPEWNPYWD